MIRAYRLSGHRSDDFIRGPASSSPATALLELVYNHNPNMSRRGVGLGAFANRNQATQSYATHGANLRSTHLASLQTQLSVFQSLLHTFALEHSSTIKSNPSFRAEFARMCNTIGVDPLAASNVKGKNGRRGLGEGGSFWTQIMGGDMNDFYFEVAVRVVELCRETRSENGGLIGVEECRKRVGKGKAIGSGLEVSEYVLTFFMALQSLCLGNQLTDWLLQGRYTARREIAQTPRLRLLHRPRW